MGPKIMKPILRLYDKYYQENIFINLLRIYNNQRWKHLKYLEGEFSYTSTDPKCQNKLDK